MTRFLVAYATKNGTTREVAEAIAETLAEAGVDVVTAPAADVRSVYEFDAAVLGGSLYVGRWHKDAQRFLDRFGVSLPIAVFALGPRTVAEADVAESRAQLDEALARFPEVQPVSVAVFGGAFDPAGHRFPLNRMHAFDARDWTAIAAWARGVAALVSHGEPTPVA